MSHGTLTKYMLLVLVCYLIAFSPVAEAKKGGVGGGASTPSTNTPVTAPAPAVNNPAIIPPTTNNPGTAPPAYHAPGSTPNNAPGNALPPAYSSPNTNTPSTNPGSIPSGYPTTRPVGGFNPFIFPLFLAPMFFYHPYYRRTPEEAGFPTFKNLGGPTDVQGTWVQPTSYGLAKPSGFVWTVYTGEAGNMYRQDMGRYHSWECTGFVDGQYFATYERRSIYWNGTVVYEQHCELGQVDLNLGLWYWNTSSTACPDPQVARFTNPPDTFINSITLPKAAVLTCTVATAASVVDVNNLAGPGLSPGNQTIGGVNGSTVVLPSDANPNGTEFANDGVTSAVTGVWQSDGATQNMGQLNMNNTFSSVMYDSVSDQFYSFYGETHSYQCTNFSDGEFVQSLSVTTSNETSALADWVIECSASIITPDIYYYVDAPEATGGCPDFAMNLTVVSLQRILADSAVLEPAVGAEMCTVANTTAPVSNATAPDVITTAAV
ncbi:hypothetical protein SARC_01744 [Sphaeroforma arctica JP610]|uniref:Uncharacterized protein n=1 Tax=Sphaeroforma arctica JP610 TaxID=667725 RepID=A0A0L0GB13_9EUKA|nr:hypothetical protein SARC_01744 [Sphaeroforma arctica JP610]KNC86084.1 hypothetical protein SARC_01744 [Sphaeroforma arctica JP610]|eukprot:XP_014159986.1 hypothetical protein SARC_01744 [Sphaeroforma arctica JP610]